MHTQNIKNVKVKLARLSFILNQPTRIWKINLKFIFLFKFATLLILTRAYEITWSKEDSLLHDLLSQYYELNIMLLDLTYTYKIYQKILKKMK